MAHWVAASGGQCKWSESRFLPNIYMNIVRKEDGKTLGEKFIFYELRQWLRSQMNKRRVVSFKKLKKDSQTKSKK